ncbi:MAG: hypothetical protein Q9214_005146 [Letrouitia sp. 1 TL-2023]
MALKPTYSFTIPSLCNCITLECRLYAPSRQFLAKRSSDKPWKPKGAIVAHPYAPLGGDYDNPIVLRLAHEFWSLGYIVGTFNFRGAGRSTGRTTWSSQSEVTDYSTFIGFFYYFLWELYPIAHEELRQDAGNQSSSRSSVIIARAPLAKSSTIPLILAGYSYGAFIALNLPPIQFVLNQLTHVFKGTPETQIRMRAHNLADQYKREVQLHETVQQGHLQEENIPFNLSAPKKTGIEATSHDGEASSKVTKDGQTHRSTKKSVKWAQDAEEKAERAVLEHLPMLKVADLPTPVTYYFFVSPLVPPVSTFLTMGKQLARQRSHVVHKLLYNTSEIVLGDNDYITTGRSLRKWFSKIKLDQWDKEGQRLQKLQYQCVHGAGHFWKEKGKEDMLMRIAREFVTERVESGGTQPAPTRAQRTAERTAAWATAVAEQTPGYGPTGLETVAE